MVDAISARRLEDGEEKDLEVEEKRSVVDVPDIEAKLLSPRKGVATVDLRPAGDAGANLVASHLLGRIARKVSRGERARTDERHFPREDVQELRQFVQGGRAQEPTEPRKTLGVCALAAAHRAELEHREDAPAFARSLLAKQDRTPVCKHDCERDNRGERDP